MKRLARHIAREATTLALLVGVAGAALGCNGTAPSHANGGTSGAAASGGISASGGRGGQGGHAATGGKASASGGAGGTAGGAGGGSCEYGGVVYPAGSSFPTGDGCNMCSCSAGRAVCTFRACLPDGGTDDVPPAVCAFAQSYQYGPIGGNSLYSTHAVLTPPASYAFVRMGSQRADAGDLSCAPALPTCNSAGVLDVADIMADIVLPDVQHALAQTTPPSYGRDDRPSDGTMFQFVGLDGRGFLVGGPCSTTDATCVPPPDGVARLVADLRALDGQQLMDPSCAPLR